MHDVERAIARIGARQDNVIAREQLVAAGLGRGAIAHRLRVRWMQRLHQGVYLIGPAPPTQMARARAAVMACGAGAVLSHRSAAELFRLLPETHGAVDVTIAGRNPKPQPGIRLHRITAFARGELTKMCGIPLTSIARTICDLAATETPREVEHAFQEALYRDIVSDRGVAAVLEREPRRRGARVIRALLRDPRMTRSEKERALLKLLDQAQLPRPLTNVRLHGYLVDAYWPVEGVVVEFDGWRGHGHRLAFESNRKRDQVMLANGLRVIRVTDRQFEQEPVAIAVRIATTLQGGSALRRPPAGIASAPAGV